MNIYRILAEIFGRNPNTPKHLGIISKEDLIKLFDPKKTYIYVLDSKYKLTSKEKVEEFLLNDNVSFQKFRIEKNDCENFAIQLAGRLNEWAPEFASGFALSKTHAFNVFVDDKKRIWIIEPQTDEIFRYTSRIKAKYKLEMVLI